MTVPTDIMMAGVPAIERNGAAGRPFQLRNDLFFIVRTELGGVERSLPGAVSVLTNGWTNGTVLPALHWGKMPLESVGRLVVSRSGSLTQFPKGVQQIVTEVPSSQASAFEPCGQGLVLLRFPVGDCLLQSVPMRVPRSSPWALWALPPGTGEPGVIVSDTTVQVKAPASITMMSMYEDTGISSDWGLTACRTKPSVDRGFPGCHRQLPYSH